MSHDALIAYLDENGTFTVCESPWGGHELLLYNRITELEPLGGDNDIEPPGFMELTQKLEEMADGTDMEVGGRAVEQQQTTCINPEPLCTNVSITDVVELTDNIHVEALYIVEQDFSVTAYSVEHVSIGDVIDGNLLVSPRHYDGGPQPKSIAQLSGQIRAHANQLGSLFDSGAISSETVRDEFFSAVLSLFESTNKHVLAHSTCIPSDLYTEHWAAFVEYSSRSLVLNMHAPGKYKEIKPWQVPEELDLPPTIRDVEPSDWFSDLFDNETDASSSDTDMPDSQVTLGGFSESSRGANNADENDLDLLPNGIESIADISSPKVQIPIGRNKAGLTIDGEFQSLLTLPPEARKVYEEYVDNSGPGIGETTLYACDKCNDRFDGYETGYLTTSSNVGEYKNTYTCPATWESEQLMDTVYRFGRFAPCTWEVDVTVNGDSERVLHPNAFGDSQCSQESMSRDYEFVITEVDEYHADADVVAETSVTVTSPSNDVIIDSDDVPTKTITGTLNGWDWELDVSFSVDAIRADLTFYTDSGDVLTYAYRETDGMEHQNPNEILAFNPEDTDIDVSADDVTVEKAQAEISSYLHEHECGSTEFTQVWPDNSIIDADNVVNPNRLDSEDVPNPQQHLSRIQSEISDGISQQEMLDRVQAICYVYQHVYDEYIDAANTDEQTNNSVNEANAD